MTGCPYCDGDCAGANLDVLTADALRWLWLQLAEAADRRGDPVLVAGAVTVRGPVDAEQRAAVLGLLPGRPVGPGQARRVDLKELTTAVRRHGASLTPGAVAAHAAGRRLSARTRRRDERTQFEQWGVDAGSAWAASSSSPVAARWDIVWPGLRRSGWVARLQRAVDSDRLLRQAFTVLDALPQGGNRVDRRVLASAATGTPHGLDDGEVVAGLVLALLNSAGVTAAGQRPRNAWAAVGVDCDDLTGGLVAVGIHPAGWSLPDEAVVTLPPRELGRCSWPQARAGSWVFVTENPSVTSAAADLATTGVPVRVLCTSGTPSALELAAIGRLAQNGWSVAVRADFDAAGLAHVTALLRCAPTAVPWRMSAADYAAASTGEDEPALGDVTAVDWDRELVSAMRHVGAARFEEALLPQLLEDLRRGRPPKKGADGGIARMPA